MIIINVSGRGGLESPLFGTVGSSWSSRYIVGEEDQEKGGISALFTHLRAVAETHRFSSVGLGRENISTEKFSTKILAEDANPAENLRPCGTSSESRKKKKLRPRRPSGRSKKSKLRRRLKLMQPSLYRHIYSVINYVRRRNCTTRFALAHCSPDT